MVEFSMSQTFSIIPLVFLPYQKVFLHLWILEVLFHKVPILGCQSLKVVISSYAISEARQPSSRPLIAVVVMPVDENIIAAAMEPLDKVWDRVSHLLR